MKAMFGFAWAVIDMVFRLGGYCDCFIDLLSLEEYTQRMTVFFAEAFKDVK